jgi:hypothetical protein
LDVVIENSVDYINTLYLGNIPDEIVIENYLLNTKLESVNNTLKTETNRYSKTIELLDNLNKAVLSVMEQKQNPTGTNVGKAMRKPISAPAVSDALKNHKSKILTLFENYPERWNELKKYFKPIQNISIYRAEKIKISS